MLILVTGGARSGKSRHAEALIADSPQVLYLATSQIVDDEMAQRIQHHRDSRPAHWRTVAPVASMCRAAPVTRR